MCSNTATFLIESILNLEETDFGMVHSDGLAQLLLPKGRFRARSGGVCFK